MLMETMNYAMALSTIKDRPELVTKTMEKGNLEQEMNKIHHWKSECLIMIPQLANNRLAEVLQKYVDEFTVRLDKAAAALTKIMKTKPDEVNRKGIHPLKEKIEALIEEFVNYCNWGERFGVRASKRQRKTRGAD